MTKIAVELEEESLRADRCRKAGGANRVSLSDSPLPFVTKLELARTGPWSERQKVDQEALEFAWLIQHGKMPRLLKVDGMDMLRHFCIVLQRRRWDREVILPADNEARREDLL